MKQIDLGSPNPRMQCAVCGRWMRLHGKKLLVLNGEITEVPFQRFHGGCAFHNGDHLAGNGDDVCDKCCHSECMKLAGEKRPQSTIFESAD